MSINNKGKDQQQVIAALFRVINKRNYINLKDSYKKLKTFKNKRQAVL